MKKLLACSLTLFAAGVLLAADANPKEDVANAATALGNQPNYAWRTTVDLGNNSNFRPGPTEGKTEKDGYTRYSMSFNDNTTEVVLHGTNAAIKTPDNGWQSLAEAMQDSGGGFNPARFVARMAQNFKAPAAQAASLASGAAALQAGTNGITGDLTADAAKELLSFRGGNATVTQPKGSVTFWLADGKLVKFQTHVTGTVTFNNNDRDVDRTTTTEIKEVGSTKVEVPDEAKKKLE